MTTEEIVLLVQKKYRGSYKSHEVEAVSKEIEKLSPVIKKALETFLTTGKILELNILGYSVKKFKEDFEMNELAAYLTLDWIIREPDLAMRSLKEGIK